MIYDVIVIGGGASGMTAAICAARQGNQVLLLEKGSKLGRKIAASGNGKCNLTNKSILPSDYHDSYPKELTELLKKYDTDKILGFMKSIGLICKEKRGGYYPMSEQAAVVVQLLEAELLHQRVVIQKEEAVTNLCHNDNNRFTVMTEKADYVCNCVIVSMGGRAASKLGGNDTGYRFLSNLGHTVNQTFPALVQMTAAERYIKKVSGVRTEAEITLTIGQSVYHENGEILYTDTGVSGIPVFQLSRYISEAIQNGQKPFLQINLLSQISEDVLLQNIKEMILYNPELPTEYLFRSCINHKLVYELLREAGFDPELPCGKLTTQEPKQMISVFQRQNLRITGTNGFEQAQVTKGGVPLYEVNMETMESKKRKGLYITGELLDVDGICGGYNLHFAWASGMIAGSACRRMKQSTERKER